jgi:hypothetical protein
VLFSETLKGLVFGGGLLEVEAGAVEAVVDVGEVGGAASGFEAGESGAGFGEPGFGGFDLGLQGGVGEDGEDLAAGDALAFADFDVADHPGRLGAGGLPSRRARPCRWWGGC